MFSSGYIRNHIGNLYLFNRIDAVKAGVDEKGCWTASEDGFEGRTITREERNILQDLVNHGYVKR